MNDTLRNSLIIIVFFFVSLFIYSKIAGPISFSVNNVNTENTAPFQTTGTGEVKGTPDQASVSLGVTQNSTTADDARAKANAIINKVTLSLKALGIKEADIKTTNFSVYPNNPSQVEPMMAPSDSTIMPIRQTATGFTASANIEVKTSSVDLANKAIDAASADGANVIGGVNFTFDDKTKESLENQARNLAVADAKKKAEALANSAGIKLGRVINISESGSGFPMPMIAEEKSADNNSQTNLNPGENTISITVTLTFETN